MRLKILSSVIPLSIYSLFLTIQAKPLPHEYFSRLPAYENVRISPNGTKLAFVENSQHPEISILNIFDLTTGTMTPILQSDNQKIKFNWHKWANNNVLMASASYETKTPKVRYYQTRLYGIDTRKKDVDLVLMLRRANARSEHVSQYMDNVIDWLPDDPDYILMQADLDKQLVPSVYKVNVYNGKDKRVEKGKHRIRHWTTDEQHQLRIGYVRNYETGDIKYLHRFDGDSDWETLFEYTAFSTKPISVLGFGKDPNELYYLAYDGDYRAFYKMTLDDKQSEQILKHEGHDISGPLIYRKTDGEVIGIYDSQSEHGEYYFDDSEYALIRGLDKAFPEHTNTVIDTSKDGQVYILYNESDRKAGQYYLGNRTEQSLQHIFGTYPELDNVTMPTHETYTFEARDGVQIEAIITLPLTGKKPFPVVMHPHGGPGSKDTTGFDPFVAFLTNQGYAVIRPNFRGSTGFGYEFAQAQMGAWGLEMQDDIEDALMYFSDKGLVDANNACIFGASYGGYAAMMATTKTPDLYRCAVSFAGVSDLALLTRSMRKFVGGDLTAEEQIGDDRKDLDARSPITAVHRINTPLLVIHGEDDIIVDVRQSRDFIDELQKHNKQHRYVEFEYGDHYLSIQRNRMAFFAELEAFLAQHLNTAP